ncbi:MAG TPA: DUF87 domain-containing protein [Candidatus Saccharimonadales bacterium]|nr:DUF87 domain-containing protein [Candidatus Saccharimonadales bacterium]
MLTLNDALNFLGHNIFDHTLSIVLLGAAAYLLYRWVLEPASTIVKGALTFWRVRKSPATYLEIIPPKHSEKSLLATQQLFTVLQQTIGSNKTASLEIISSRKEGVRYLIRISSQDIEALQRQVASYVPDARFREVKDEPQVLTGSVTTISQPSQRRHYAYPLIQNEELKQSDVVAYVAGSMSKLKPGETMALQMVIMPFSSRWANRIYNKILNTGYAQIDGKLQNFIIARWWVWAAALLIGALTNNISLALSWGFIFLVASLFVKRDGPVLTPHEQELYQSVLNKLGQPLFRTDVRIVVTAETPQRANQLFKGVSGSLAPLDSPFQALGDAARFRNRFTYRFREFKFIHRLPSLLVTNSSVFAASELASIYHFPYGTITTEGMVRSHSRTLPATLGMKNNDFDVVLGQNSHHGEVTPIGLTAAERERHMFIIGGTGNGKTTMLQYAIAQDIQNGKGVAVVDPHGDMAEELLRHIPDERINDVIYFNPDDLAHPIGMNLLELTPGLDGDELLREKDLVTEAVVSVFRKIFSEDDSGGHRIEYVLRNAIQTALYVQDATLFTVYDLLNDPGYRKKVLTTIDDKNLINFWKQELGKAGDMQKVKMAAGITAKIGRFLFSASAKRILEQPRSTINFDEILEGKILICNFSKGLIGEDTSELFGIAVLAKLQLASLRRARLKQTDRKPFYLYVDEFQNFATPSFVQMLSEARKYKVYLTMAEQTTSQQDEQQMVNIILANVGAVICFRSGNPSDEKLVLPLFEPYIKKGEIANLPSYNFYMRASAQKSQEPLSGETIVLKDGKQVTDKVIEAARKYAQQPRTEVRSIKQEPSDKVTKRTRKLPD